MISQPFMGWPGRKKQMNANGGASHQDWELFLMTSIADSLVVIADCLTVITKEEMKDGNVV